MNFRKSLLVLFAGSMLVACEDDTVDYVQSARPTVSVTSPSLTVFEGDDAVVTLTSDRPSRKGMDFKVEVLSGGSAVDVDDFKVNALPSDITVGWGVDAYYVTFPANQTNFSFSVSTILDDLLESDENMSIRISPIGNMVGGVSANNDKVDFVIKNRPQTFLRLTLDWNQNFDLNGTMTSLCEYEYDNDFVVFDGSFSTVLDQAATSDCPEVLELDLADYADGDYHIIQNVWDDGGLSSEGLPTFNLPVNVHYSRGGTTFSGTYVQDSGNAVNSDFGSDPDGNNLAYVVSFNVSGDVFTLFDLTTSTTIGSGRMAQLKSILKNKTNGLRKR